MMKIYEKNQIDVLYASIYITPNKVQIALYNDNLIIKNII